MTKNKIPPDPSPDGNGTEFPFPDPERQQRDITDSIEHHHRPHDPLPPMGEFGLKRGIQPWMANLIAIGGIIGSCYFLGTGYLISQMGPSVILLYALGGLIIYTVMQSFAELLVNVPRQGNFISYSAEFISPTWAVGTGWSYWFNWCAYIPSEAVAGGIIMHVFVSEVPVVLWAIAFLLMITILNLIQVGGFGWVESSLAIVKIAHNVIFCIVAALIVLGLIGSAGFIGTSVVFPPNGNLYDDIFPAGWFILIANMALILVNFQGSEIVGLAAAETQDPKKTVPKACRMVVHRIIRVDILPILFLILIIPYAEAGLTDSVFSTALANYGFKEAAAILSFIVLTAAFSCANSGFYGAVRALYGLSLEGMAPRFLSKLNRHCVPMVGTLMTLVCCWLVLSLWWFTNGEGQLYIWLLSVSAFTGAICWISICLAQVVFRKRIYERGYTDADIIAPAPLSPWMPVLIGVVLEVIALVVLAFNEELVGSLYLSIPVVFVPMIVYWVGRKTGRIRGIKFLNPDEKSFDELFPDKRGKL
ncbi:MULTISPECIES: amino acid permease [unclassified Methanoregula]|uniref:amino acid permease n=1 Tax=unclassified Methanoregula TaxID=2649730 RepID=UPI0009CF2B09|nr:MULTISPECIES: amino acid permease [unclassified Methanoregula]OPX61803.1 MAG: lysine transporter [Methanoregula sp. PtaB.Bin085]